MKTYDQKKQYRCARNYSVTYTCLKGEKVVLSVSQFGIDNLVPVTEGDGEVFNSIESAREFAFKKDYLVEFNHKQELADSLTLNTRIRQNNLNKPESADV